MGIPVYISRVPRTQPLPPVQMPCQNCRAVTVHQVVRRYYSVHVYHLPMVSQSTEHHYMCSNCGFARQGPAPQAAPAKPFLHRFGCFVFVGVPILLLIAYAVIDNVISRLRREAFIREQVAQELARAEQKAKEDEARTAAKAAKTAFDEAKKQCFAAIDAALGALPKKVIDLPAQKPADTAPLVGAGTVILGDSYIPKPASKYWGKQACVLQLSKELDDLARYGTVGYGDVPDIVLAQAKTLMEQVKTLTAPPVIVARDHACPNTRKRCVGSAVWIDVATKKVLAVRRVEKAVEHGGKDKDLDGLSTLLEKEADGW
jgi:hypothetical protein